MNGSSVPIACARVLLSLLSVRVGTVEVASPVSSCAATLEAVGAGRRLQVSLPVSLSTTTDARGEFSLFGTVTDTTRFESPRHQLILTGR